MEFTKGEEKDKDMHGGLFCADTSSLPFVFVNFTRREGSLSGI
jgi:hypothetical protein